ncbi:MAG: lactate utilization protein, partial [Candidatus Aminicenantes bacterium]|nr:lactate utilization protein [Candidatus Aminicenantes bacterium]
MRQKLKKEYKKEIKFSLKNSFLRAAMDKFAVAYRTGEAKTFFNTNKKELIAKIAEIKKFSISSLDSLYETFRKNAESKGVKVWFAKTAEEANKIISGLAEKRGYIKIIKSKSMTSEEIQLNTFLEKRGFTVIETDLGEWIIQLRKEGPSHMVMPAIHLSRYQVSDLFSL